MNNQQIKELIEKLEAIRLVGLRAEEALTSELDETSNDARADALQDAIDYLVEVSEGATSAIRALGEL